MIRVAVIDDHPIVRDGVEALLSSQDDIAIAATGATASDALAIARSGAVDAMVLDLELPDRSALEIIGEIKHVERPPAIIIFSAYAGEERVMRAFESGADSYVLKDTPASELIDIIRSVARGGAISIPAAIAAELARASRLPRAARLTDRERQILSYVAEGLSNRSIAERAEITERTVKFHVSGILARLGAASRSEAVAIARARGLL